MSLPVRAVEGLDSLVRDRMQSHRLIIAPNICEAPNSVPMLTCLSDLRASMTRLSSHARRVLPERISGNGCRPTAYARTLQPLAGSENADRQCQERHRSAFDLAICTTAAVFASVTDMFYAARLAGVTLPQGKQKKAPQNGALFPVCLVVSPFEAMDQSSSPFDGLPSWGSFPPCRSPWCPRRHVPAALSRGSGVPSHGHGSVG